MECSPEARTVKAAEKAVARQWFSSHMIAATDTHATTQEMLEDIYCAVRAEPI
jgi:hypothetical protein